MNRQPRKEPRRNGRRFGTAFLTLVLGMTIPVSGALGVGVAPGVAGAATSPSGCPWVAASLTPGTDFTALAREVTTRMTLSEKANFVVLKVRGRVENSNVGVPRLCVPALTLTDGPDGVGSAQHGVTQFPAAIAVAASFNVRIARSVGVAMGQETRAKGFDVLQGPNLNLSRVPLSGRIFETYGEDPALTSAMGVAAIEGIQSNGVMADAKHFTGYTQETARGRVNQLVPTRALAELYNVPFRAAVTQAHVASIMCAMGSLNGVNTCSSPSVYSTLRSWGFTGFTRSDYRAIYSVSAAFTAGMSLVKPGSAAQVISLVQQHRLSVTELNRAVEAVLVEMFRYGFIAHPRMIALGRTVTSPVHAQVALRAAEAGIVLLKNHGSLLPLPSTLRSIAVIGTDAKTAAMTTGGGSSTVRAPYVITPLRAITTTWGHATRITYSPGGPAGLELDQLQFSDLLSGKPLPKQIPIVVTGEPGKADLALEFSHLVTRSVATATSVGKGDGWSHWRVVFRPPHTGTYEFSIQQIGDTWFAVDGRTIFSSPGIHGPTNWATSVRLIGGRHYTLSAHWFSVNSKIIPKLGVSDVTASIAAAVAAARKAQVAVVFAGSFSTEGADQPSLWLPGDANALISAVAAANPHTVVVLNTSGAVYMPWLSHVAAVVEAWYPGQMDGTAIASVLSGAVNPSGHLPISFPQSTTAQPVATGPSFPGVKSNVSFGSGLDVGYRWFQANGVSPLFPFGFGLSYTSFAMGSAHATTTASGVRVTFSVTNTGGRAGSAAVQAYVSYPTGSGEPPEQLRAFAQVSLRAHQSRTVSLVLPRSAFQQYTHGALAVVPGSYGINLGFSSAILPEHVSVTLT